MAAAMPPTTLFPPTYRATGGTGSEPQRSDQGFYNQVQDDYLAMFNAMNPGGGGGGATGTKGTAGGGGAIPSRPTVSMPGTIPSVGVGGPPALNLPAYDEGKVASLTQQYAAPGIRNLRNTVQQVQQGYYENPNVKAQTLRDTLAGYGQGLESVMAGAGKSAVSEYGQEYGAEVSGAMQTQSLTNQANIASASLANSRVLAQYQDQWQAYLRGL